MKKHLTWGLILVSSLAFAQTAKKELEQLSTKNNSSETQYNQSKNQKNNSANKYGSGDRFMCESYRGQRQHCAADTSGGVRLVKQIGYNSCQGNWGYDYYGVWVANGCRGEFQIDRYQDYYGQTNDVIRCESYSQRRQTCARDLKGAEVSLIHQLSNQTCQGNWGYNYNEVWVSKGCKADFYVSHRNNGLPQTNNNGIVECRSVGNTITNCQVPDLQSVELIDELGNQYQGSCRGNWGYSSHGLWVRSGCHARFRVTEYQETSHSNNGHNNPGNQGNEIICESNYGQVRTCQTDTRGGVDFVQNLSNISCDNRWGYDANGIWVKDGCRARFVTYPDDSVVNQQVIRESLTVKCKSRQNKMKICDTKGPFIDVEFKREISKGKYPCEGNWGVNPKGQLFVVNSCYAEFKVYR